MKLYKTTLIWSIVVLCVFVILSFVFEFTFLSKINIISFLSDYMIGVACSIVVVIITTFLQFKYEQRNLLNSILSDVRFFLFHFLLAAMSFDPKEEAPEALHNYHFDELYNGIKKISAQLSNIQWFSKKKGKIAVDLQKSAMLIMIDMTKHPNRQYNLRCILDTPLLKELKENALLLDPSNEHVINEIVENYDDIQAQLKNLKTVKKH